jgi:HD superfamily phosphohydrolase
MNKRKYIVNNLENEKSLLDYIERSKGKSIRDPIYDYIPLSKVEMAIVDSPWMQRLREIKQMGTTNRTYISANNTRFEHSLGVCYLAGEMLNSLDKNTRDEFNEAINIMKEIDPEINNYLKVNEVSDSETMKLILKQVVRLVALLHDIGHGPFSHVSERFIKYGDEYKKFNKLLHPHEICSLELMLNEIPNGITCGLKYWKDSETFNYFNEYDIIKNFLKCKELIQSLFIPIYGESNSLQPFSMIINSQLDADKLDYLRREAYATGSEFGIALDVKRIIDNLKIYRNCLCIRKNALSAAESLIDSRYKAYRYIHTHHTKVQMDEILQRAIFHGLMGNVFSIENEETINDPFQAKYFGEVVLDDNDSLQFKYGTIDDHFIVQRIRESKNNNQASNRSKFYLEKFEKRKLFKSFWKVSDPLTLIEDEINSDAVRDAFKRSYLDLIEELLSLDKNDNISQHILNGIEEEIKNKSVLCRLHTLISKFEDKKDSIEKLEEYIADWINQKKIGKDECNKLTHKDIIIAHLQINPYPVPIGEDYRKRIMIVNRDQLQDLLYFSPEVRGFVVHWTLERLFHGIYIFFSTNGLKSFPEKENDFFKILLELIDDLEKQEFI